MRVLLCGVRGSIPSPGAEFAGIGGQTSCVALAHDGEPPSLVLDAGTGLRALTKRLGGPFHGTLVLGHMHWDHVIGLPFFGAGDRPDARVRMLVPEQGPPPLELLDRAMAPPLFPITARGLRGEWSFGTYDEGVHELEGFTVLAREIPHKGGRTMGLRVSDGRSAVTYMSDHAPQDLGPGEDGLGALHPNAVELADGADLLLHDAQYTAAELPTRGPFGHAAADYAVTLARRCRVPRVLLFHHDPARTDDEVREIAASLQQSGDGPMVEAATEGVEIDL
jgi:phosphoribosyl 1,2-cyclic phosphodiesterase